MALRITKAAEPIHVDRLKMVVYGQPGCGKSSIAFTADAPLLLDFDGGAYRAANRKDIVQIGQWSDAAAITKEDLDGYKTVIIDTAGRALDMLTIDIGKSNPKAMNGGALTLQGYGVLKARFGAYLNLLNSFGLDVVLIAHMEEKQRGDEIIERIDVQGGSKGEIYKAADAMGRVTIENGQRWLKFSPTDAQFGKNPGQLDPLLVPAPTKPEFENFLGRAIATTKAKLNELNAAQVAAAEKQRAFREKLDSAKTAEAINALIPEAKEGGETLVALLHARATKELGLVPDKATKAYAAAPAEQPKSDETKQAEAA
jgi:hypothetical protein